MDSFDKKPVDQPTQTQQPPQQPQPLNQSYDANMAEQDLSQGVAMMKDDPSQFEVDTEPFLDRIYNEILGNSQVEGAWTRDPNKVRIMNELGASTFTHDISSRFSVHTNFSELNDEAIRNLVTWACDSWADNLEDNYLSWKANPSFGNLMSISERMYSILYIVLNIARNAGMRKHRERSKNPYLRVSDQQQQQMMQGVL